MQRAIVRILRISAALALASSPYIAIAQNPPVAMSKTISYRGGIVTFSLPRAWQEEYEPSGGGTFYDSRQDSGTLRLNVLSFESKGTPANQMALAAFPAGSFELIGKGFPLRKAVEKATEDNEALHIHKWDVAVPVPPNSLRLVLFSYTILASQETEVETKAELSLINNSVRAAAFSQAAGVPGNYKHE